jgi:CspA family cold shock protein
MIARPAARAVESQPQERRRSPFGNRTNNVLQSSGVRLQRSGCSTPPFPELLDDVDDKADGHSHHCIALAGGYTVGSRRIVTSHRSVSRLFLWRAAMPQGTIKKLVADRGFGFLKGDQGEIFFHRSEVQGVEFENLREGQKVEYQIGQGKKGPCATCVRVV